MDKAAQLVGQHVASDHRVLVDQQPGLDAATQEDTIDWQTQELTANLMRDDTSNHDWKLVAADQSTEAEAEAVLKALLGGAE